MNRLNVVFFTEIQNIFQFVNKYKNGISNVVERTVENITFRTSTIPPL